MAEINTQVHPEIYKFFNLDPLSPQKDLAQLRYINDHTSSRSQNISDALKQIKRLEIKLGVPKVGETRISKLYNYLRLTDDIASLENTMKDKLADINIKTKHEIDQIKVPYQEKISKLSDEIKKAEDSYKKALKAFRLNANNSTRNVLAQFNARLNELKELKRIYKGGK